MITYGSGRLGRMSSFAEDQTIQVCCNSQRLNIANKAAASRIWICGAALRGTGPALLCT